MNESTLGRRIQEGRRAAGLSQEALGERLRVSRQAVSKWEADAAIPELENLIAMSRIFGMSIGRLLGVEPEQAEKPGPANQPPEDGGLTEKELAAVEAIAAKYAEEAQRHQRPGWSRQQKAIAAGLAVILVLAAGTLVKGQMHAINRRLNDVQDQVGRIESSVARQVGSLSQQMSNILDEKNHILAASQATVTDFDPDAQTVTLCVTASPKEWTDTTTAVFTAALSDGRQFTAEAQGQNGTFAAEGFVVPMDQAVALSVNLLDGGSARTGVMETLYDCLPECFLLDVWGSYWEYNWLNGDIWFNGLRLNISNNTAIPLNLEAVELYLFRNQETEPEWSSPVPEAAKLWRESGSLQMYIRYLAQIRPKVNDTIVAAARITDDHGQSFWQVLNVCMNINGKLYSDQFSSADLDWQPGQAVDSMWAS